MCLKNQKKELELTDREIEKAFKEMKKLTDKIIEEDRKILVELSKH